VSLEEASWRVQKIATTRKVRTAELMATTDCESVQVFSICPVQYPACALQLDNRDKAQQE